MLVEIVTRFSLFLDSILSFFVGCFSKFLILLGYRYLWKATTFEYRSEFFESIFGFETVITSNVSIKSLPSSKYFSIIDCYRRKVVDIKYRFESLNIFSF